tara:strand:- start:820 stop:1356 length:537 start_codon:yes stop_codon:yes gene_type:complete
MIKTKWSTGEQYEKSKRVDRNKNIYDEVQGIDNNQYGSDKIQYQQQEWQMQGQSVGQTQGQYVGQTQGQYVGQTQGQSVGQTQGQSVGQTHEEPIDMRDTTEMVFRENKKEEASERMAQRHMTMAGTMNPYVKSDYLTDIKNQEEFLKPQRSGRDNFLNLSSINNDRNNTVNNKMKTL